MTSPAAVELVHSSRYTGGGGSPQGTWGSVAPRIGDLAFVVINFKTSSLVLAVTPPAGWTELNSEHTGLTSRGAGFIFVRECDGNELASASTGQFVPDTAYPCVLALFVAKTTSGRRFTSVPVAADVTATACGTSTHSLPAATYGGALDNTQYHLFVSSDTQTSGAPGVGWTEDVDTSGAEVIGPSTIYYSIYALRKATLAGAGAASTTRENLVGLPGVAFSFALTEAQTTADAFDEAKSASELSLVGGLGVATSSLDLPYAVVGDVLLAALVFPGTTPTEITPPTGFSVIGSITTGNVKTYLFSKKISGTANQRDPSGNASIGRYTFTANANCAVTMALIQDTDVNVVGAFDSGTGSVTVPQVTLSSGGRIVVMSAHLSQISGGDTCTGLPNKLLAAVGGRYGGVFDLAVSSGATGTKSYAVGAAYEAVAVMVGLGDAPAASGDGMPLLMAHL